MLYGSRARGSRIAGGHVKTTVAIDQDLEVRSDGFSNRSDHLDAMVLGLGAQLAAQVPVLFFLVMRLPGIDLQSLLAGLGNGPGMGATKELKEAA